MRIISGSLKGRRITAPKKLPVRPTTDRSKEALFNILTNWVEFSEIRVLDLFSGTGNISYEFGSRGVNDIVAVDQNNRCLVLLVQSRRHGPLRTNEIFRHLQLLYPSDFRRCRHLCLHLAFYSLVVAPRTPTEAMSPHRAFCSASMCR